MRHLIEVFSMLFKHLFGFCEEGAAVSTEPASSPGEGGGFEEGGDVHVDQSEQAESFLDDGEPLAEETFDDEPTEEETEEKPVIEGQETEEDETHLDDGEPLTEEDPNKPKTAEAEKEADKKAAAEAEKKESERPEALKSLFGEDGKLDSKSYIDLFKPGKTVTSVDLSSKIEKTPEGEKPKEKDERSPIQKHFEEIAAYKKDLKTNISMPMAYYQAYRKQGHSEADAIFYANQMVNEKIGEHCSLYETEQRVAFEENRSKQGKEKEDFTTSQGKAISNERLVAAEVGGQKLYDQFVFDKQLGGIDVNMLYDIMNPDKKFGNAEDLKKDMETWFTNMSARGTKILSWIAEIGRLRLMNLAHPDLVKKIQKSKDVSDKVVNNAKTKKPGQSAGKAAENNKGDSVEDYIYGHEKRLEI